jgi:hypothetical protein
MPPKASRGARAKLKSVAGCLFLQPHSIAMNELREE